MIDLTKLHALADGELAAEDAKQLREELVSDSEAKQELNTIYNLKDCVRDRAVVYTCDVTWSASLKRVAELDRTRRVESIVGRYAWGISGAFLVAICVGNVVTRNLNKNHVGSAELAGIAAKLFPSTRQAPAGPTPYSQWLDSLLPRARNLLGPNRVVQIANMPVEIEGRRSGLFEFRDALGEFNILVIPGPMEFDGMDTFPMREPYVTGRINGMNCVARSLGGQSIVVFAPRDYEQLSEIASHIATR